MGLSGWWVKIEIAIDKLKETINLSLMEGEDQWFWSSPVINPERKLIT